MSPKSHSDVSLEAEIGRYIDTPAIPHSFDMQSVRRTLLESDLVPGARTRKQKAKTVERNQNHLSQVRTKLEKYPRRPIRSSVKVMKMSREMMELPGLVRNSGWTKSVLVMLGLQVLVGDVKAQIGETLCACQPAFYEMTFNFSLMEPDQNVGGAGIQNSQFLISNLAQPDNKTANVVPVQVSKVTILELVQPLQDAVAEAVLDDGFLDGSTFTYTSIITNFTALNSTTLPRAFQLLFEGQNEAGEALVQSSYMAYTNDCSDFPVLIEGQNFGWITFVSHVVAGFSRKSDIVLSSWNQQC